MHFEPVVLGSATIEVESERSFLASEPVGPNHRRGLSFDLDVETGLELAEPGRDGHAVQFSSGGIGLINHTTVQNFLPNLGKVVRMESRTQRFGERLGPISFRWFPAQAFHREGA